MGHSAYPEKNIDFMPHVAHVAFLNFAEIHPSDEVADSEKVLLSFDLITEV